jgi:creatinine amidohydrolase
MVKCSNFIKMSYRLESKSWVKIQKEVKDNDTVIVPLGSLEAHGTHKPVGCCYLLAKASSEDVGLRTGIPVTPIIPFGVSSSYKNFSGTITVSMNTLSQYVYEACESLVRTGFKKIIFFSAHGGNNLPVLREISFKLREKYGALCAVLHIWGIISKMAPKDFWERDQKLGHGGDPTTSVMLHLYPELVEMSKIEYDILEQKMENFKTLSYSNHEFKELTQNIYLFAEEVQPNGYMGDPKKASAIKGRELYEETIDYLVDFVNAFSRLSS